MKTTLYLILLLILPSTCVENETLCHSTKSVGIQFTPPFDYEKSDILKIDDLEFTHITYLDSLELGNYLPNKTVILLEVGDKLAKEKSNSISIGRVLAKKLKKTNQYSILNGPELLTTGKLRISRKDSKTIKICFPKNYSARILQ